MNNCSLAALIVSGLGYTDLSLIAYQSWNIVFQLYIVGPVLYQCILRVCCYTSLGAVYSHYIFFPKIDCTLLVLIPMMFIAKSWKNVKISERKLEYWAMHFLSMKMTYNLKTFPRNVLRLTRNPPKAVNTSRNQKIHENAVFMVFISDCDGNWYECLSFSSENIQFWSDDKQMEYNVSRLVCYETIWEGGRFPTLAGVFGKARTAIVGNEQWKSKDGNWTETVNGVNRVRKLWKIRNLKQNCVLYGNCELPWIWIMYSCINAWFYPFGSNIISTDLI